MKATRITASLLGISFLAFAAVQYNDPDAVLWILIYFVAATLCFLVLKNRASPLLLLVACILYGIGALYMWPAKFEGISIGGGDIKNIEEARESLGLAVCSISFAVLALLSKYSARKRTASPEVAKQNGLI